MTRAWNASASASARRPAPESARDRGGDTAAHGARGHHLHQHQHGEHQRHAGQRIGAELADEIRLDEANRRLHQHHEHIRRGESHQRAEDRALEQHAGSRVEASPFEVTRHVVGPRRSLVQVGDARLPASRISLRLQTLATRHPIPISMYPHPLYAFTCISAATHPDW
jgi:hypothetical protein